MKFSKMEISLKIFLIVFLTLVLCGISNFSYGALSYSITSGISSIEVGKTYTITVKATGLTGRFNISHSSNVSVNCSSVWVENGVADTTIKVTAKSTGKATVTFSPESIASASTGELVSLSSKTDTVTVKTASSSSSSSDTTTTKPTFTSTNKTVYAKDNINLRSSWSTSSSATPVSKGTEMTLTGTSSKAVNGYVWYRVSYNGTTKYVASSLVTTTKPTTRTDDKKDDSDAEDDNKNTDSSASVNLKSLTVTPTGLSPAFSSGTTEYTMTVGSDIDEIDVKAVAEDEKASVDITGNTDLKIGTNKITITVTASDKTTKTYHITVTKEDKKQLQLSELLVEGLPLTPEFDSNIYEYTLELDRSDVSEVNITATPSKESAEVEIVGNTDLQPGENVITILVKSADGEEITTYQITVTLPKVADVVQDNNKNMYVYIGIGACVLIVLIIIIAIIKKHRHQEEDNMYYGMYDTKTSNEEKNIGDEDKKVDGKEETSDIDLDKLPKLDGEDLPKSLRRNEKEKQEVKVNSSNVEMQGEELQQEVRTDRSKKIDEFYRVGEEEKPRRRGKHF